MGRKKKSNGLNGHAGANGTVKMTTGDGTEIEAPIVEGRDVLIGSDNGPTLRDETPLEDVETFSERAQQFFLANDFTVVGDLCCLTRAELLTANGAEEALVDHVVEQLVAKGRRLADVPRVGEPPPPVPTPKIIRVFARKLTPKERGDLSGQIVRAILQRKDLDDKIDEAKKVVSGFKKEQDVIDARVLELARQRSTGSVNDEIECVEREESDPTGEDTRPGVGLFRTDNGERVEWRPLQPHERQVPLFNEGEKIFADAAQ